MVSNTVPQRLRIGVSACLLGQPVRYDGTSRFKRERIETLSASFDFVPVCPEVELGLGIPRPKIQLERDGNAIRLIEPSTGRDLTQSMWTYAMRRADALFDEGVSGFLFKKNSPSCGLKVCTTSQGTLGTEASGRFAEAIALRFVDLPLIEEDAIDDPTLREDWIAEVFAYARRQAARSDQ